MSFELISKGLIVDCEPLDMGDGKLKLIAQCRIFFSKHPVSGVVRCGTEGRRRCAAQRGSSFIGDHLSDFREMPPEGRVREANAVCEVPRRDGAILV
ncbi:MAG: hypothetical protein ABI563_03275 [Specibacter sp.]